MKSKIFIICLLGLLIFPLNVLAEKYPIVWNPKSIEQTIGLGGTKDLMVTFESSTSLKNVDLWIVPELQPFVSIEPTRFETIEANRSYQIRVHLSVPYDTQTGLYDGTIHLKVGSKTYPQTLKIKLNAVDLMEGSIPPPDILPEIVTMQYITEDGISADIEVMEGRIIVLFNLDISETEAESLILNNGGKIISKIPSIRYYGVEVPSGSVMVFIDKIRQEPSVIFCEPDVPLKDQQLEPIEWRKYNPKLLSGMKKHLVEINAPLAWELLKGTALTDTVIAILELNGFKDFDQGLGDFYGRLLNEFPSRNTENHGTAVAALAAAEGDNDFGNVGVNWWSKIKLYSSSPAKLDILYDLAKVVLEKSGSDIPIIINASFGYGNGDGICQWNEKIYYQTLLGKNVYRFVNQINIIKNIVLPNKKFLVVKAAGNDNCEIGQFLENPKPNNLILVGGSYSAEKYSDSNWGNEIDVAAPFFVGWYDYASGRYPDAGFYTIAGTSFSAPLVAGAAALVWAKEPDLTPQQVIQRLKDTAKPVTNLEDQYKGKFGAGILDVYRALSDLTERIVGTWVGTPNPTYGYTETLNFYRDGTFVNTSDQGGRYSGTYSIITSGPQAYPFNPMLDFTVTYTNLQGGTFSELGDYGRGITISGNKMTLETDTGFDNLMWGEYTKQEEDVNAKIVFSSNRDGNGEIYVMNVDGTNQTRLTNNLASDGGPSLSPDGSKIVFTSDRDGNLEIYVMNADGTNPIRLTNNSVSDFDASWSPDGKKITFRTDRDGNEEIYVMNTDGTNPINLTNNPSRDGEPRWSPDGKKIVFSSWRSGTAEIWVMNADGTNPIQLTHNTWSQCPRWSPDGSKIGYTHYPYGESPYGEIYVMNADGTNEIRLTYTYAPDYFGSWSPNGTKIFFVTNRDGNYEIYVMNSDGSNPINLTNNPADDG